MSSALFAPVCSITSTRRRRFLWAAWWTAAPSRKPFRKPDAFEGGARTREEALRAAERVAGCRLLELDGSWARAWADVLIGKEPRPESRPDAAGSNSGQTRMRVNDAPSVWHTLGLKSDASVVEIKRAYRLRALEAHPDCGGTAELFRALQTAYETALKRRARSAARPKAR